MAISDEVVPPCESVPAVLEVRIEQEPVVRYSWRWGKDDRFPILGPRLFAPVIPLRWRWIVVKSHAEAFTLTRRWFSSDDTAKSLCSGVRYTTRPC